MRIFTESEIQALEIAVKAGLVPNNISWPDALPDVRKFFIELAQRLTDTKQG